MAKRVFFLGAGFSKAIAPSYPLLNDLSAEVIQQIEKQSVSSHYYELSNLMDKDVESLLTYLSTGFPWKNDVTKHENLALYEALISQISTKFMELAANDRFCPFPDFLKKFSQELFSNEHEYKFITMNYDTLLENLILSEVGHSINHGKLYCYPIADAGSRASMGAFGFATYGNPKTNQLPPILKLHGSANWFWAGLSPSDTIYLDNFSTDSTIRKGLKPYIIPPVMDKNIFYNHIAIHSLWADAHRFIENADEIYIIGFSFPPTDLSVKFLFQSALRLKSTDVKKTSPLVAIYVVNADAPDKRSGNKYGTLKERYERVFNKKIFRLNYDYCGSDDVVERFIREKILKEKE